MLLCGGEGLAIEADRRHPRVETLDDSGCEVVGHVAAEHRAAVNEQATAPGLIDLLDERLHRADDPRHGLFACRLDLAAAQRRLLLDRAQPLFERLGTALPLLGREPGLLGLER